MTEDLKKHISTTEKIVGNTFYSAISEFSLLLTSVFYIVSARYLGDELYGLFTASVAFVSLFMLFVIFGFTYSMTKVVVKEREKAGLFVGNALFIQAVFAAVCFVLCYLLSYGLNVTILHGKFPLEARLVIAIIFGAESLKSFNLTMRMACKALNRFEFDTIGVLLERLTLVLVGIPLLVTGHGIFAAAFVLLGARFLGFAFLFMAVRHLDPQVMSRPSLPVCRYLVRESRFYLLQCAIWKVYDQIDVVMLYSLRPAQEAGWYSAARKIFEGLWLIPNILTEAVYPELSARYLVSREHVYKLFQRAFKYMLAVSVMVAIGTVTVAHSLIIWVFTSEYKNAIIVLILFGAAVVPSYLRYLFGTTLIAINLQKKEAILATYRSLFNAAANLCLIPFYGFVGATAATVATEYIFVIPYLVILGRENLIRREQLSFIYKPFLAALILVPLYLFISRWPDYLIFIIMVGSYVVITGLVLKIFEKDELRMFRNFAGRLLARMKRRG